MDSMSYNSSNLQMKLILSSFINFTNLCSNEKCIKINGNTLSSCYNSSNNNNYKSSTSLYLPSNTNKDYNNRWMPINVDKIYEDVLVENKNWIMEGTSNNMQI